MRKIRAIIGTVLAICIMLSLCACGTTPTTKTVTAIALERYQSEYFVGDAFDGGKLRVTYSDETEESVDLTAAMLTGFDTSTAGTKTVTVTYEGKTTTYTITVKEAFEIDTAEGFDVDAALADTADGAWGGVTTQTVFDTTNKFLSFREKSNASVAYLKKGMSAGSIELKMKVSVKSDTTATVTFSNQCNTPSDFFYAAGGKNYSLEFASDNKMYVKKWIDGTETKLSGSKASANIPMALGIDFTKVKIDVAENDGAVNIDVTVGSSKLLSVTDSDNPILGGGAVGFTYQGTGGMAVGGKNSASADYVAPEPLGIEVYNSPDVPVADADVDLLNDFNNKWTGRERIFSTAVAQDGSVQFTSKDNPQEPLAGVTEFQGLYQDKIFGAVQLEYTFNVVSHGAWLMFWFRCVPEKTSNVSIWGNKQTQEGSNGYSVLIEPTGVVQFHKWVGTTQIYMNGVGDKLPPAVAAPLQDSKAVNSVKMAIETISQGGREVVQLSFKLNDGQVLVVQDTDNEIFVNAGYIGLQGFATNNGTSSIRLLTAVAKQEITLE